MLPLAINARVLLLARSDAEPVTVVPLIGPEPRLSPLSISSNNFASPPALVVLKALRKPLLIMFTALSGSAFQSFVPLVPTYDTLSVRFLESSR